MSVKLASAARVTAPDGSEVRILAASPRGSMAHFSLAPGQVSRAVRHHSVEEIWFILEGVGRMWIGPGEEQVLQLGPGLSFVIPVGRPFQFRNDGGTALRAVAVTMPPWPGEDEAESVEGLWPAQV
jgi:mannose-6-phosphate isomerase-like protein (cupin superfamily)